MPGIPLARGFCGRNFFRTFDKLRLNPFGECFAHEFETGALSIADAVDEVQLRGVCLDTLKNSRNKRFALCLVLDSAEESKDDSVNR